MNKKHLTLLFAIALCAAGLSAGGIDTKSNLSTGYLRNPSRNTEDSRPEAALYNLAGTGFMQQGFAAEVGNQLVFKKYTNEAAGKEYEDHKPVLLYPNIDAVYRFGDFAVSASFHIAAGGGSLDYKDGTAFKASLLSSLGVTSHSLEVTSITYGQTLGFAYNWNDKVSASLGIRFLEATQSMKLDGTHSTLGNINVEYDAFGFGVGGIFGLQYKPLKGLDLSLQYKTITKMKMELDNVKGGNFATGFGLKDGNKFDNDLPSELNLGVGYQVLDSLYLSSSFNYYFNQHAKMGSAIDPKNSDWDDSWEISGGADWQLSEKVLLSTGLLYCKQGYTDDVNNVFGPVLDSLSFAAGVEYQVLDQLAVTYGAMYTSYFEETYKSITLNKNVFQMALSATYSF